MAIPRKRASIILAFKVLQFVNQLRRRVKPRILAASIDPVQPGTEVAQRHKGLSIISNDLSRIGARAEKQSRRVAHRVCKSRRNDAKPVRSSLKVQRSAGVPASRNVPGDEVQHMLGSVDEKLSFGPSAFSTVASSDILFLKHHHSPTFEACSLNQTVRLLVTVQDAIDVLSDCRLQYGDDWLLGQGHDAGLVMDENFIANYEHMLQRLRTALIEALARKALDELLRGGHDKKQRKLLSWFTEFAGETRPLSASFPWTIKPSLAVLWGVCWMFYDREPDEQATRGANDRVRQARVLQHLDFPWNPWNAPASSDYVELGRALIGTPPQHTPHQQTVQARNTESWEADLSPMDFRLPSLEVGQLGATGPPARAEAAAPQPSIDYGTYPRRAQHDPSVVLFDYSYLPQFQGTQPLTVYPQFSSDSLSNSWHPFPSSPQESPRHPLNSGQTPSIRVTRTPGSQQFAQPHQSFASFGNIYPPARQPEALLLNSNTAFEFAQPPYLMDSSLLPESSSMQIPQNSIKHERTSSINSNSNMPTPVPSPTSVERTHMVTSPQHISRHHSIASSEQDGEDEGSLRKNYSYKRAEEPPRNQDGKMMCVHHECSSLSFDRKCEWSKHMDKHDRPYKCLVKGCEKLQGFTYSGGLLRHEREVHKMHGGTKKALFCRFADCKRSSGAGFTRKENLAEHIRRVHRRTSMSADMHGLVMRRDTMEASPIVESRVASESPYSRAMDFREDDEMTLKRKHRSDSGLSDRGNDEMRAEIKRLRQENEGKDSRLRSLEQAVMALQQNSR